MVDSKEALIESFSAAGQGQVFQFIDELNAEAQARLIAQAQTIDLAEVNALVTEHVKGEHDSTINLDGLEPAPYIALPQNGGDADQWKSASEAGAAAIQAGRVAAFTVARALVTMGRRALTPFHQFRKRHSFKSLQKKSLVQASASE